MVIREDPLATFSLAGALDSRGRPKLSRGVMTALGLVIAAHLVVAIGLYYQHFVPMAPDRVPEAPTTIVKFFRFPPPAPPKQQTVAKTPPPLATHRVDNPITQDVSPIKAQDTPTKAVSDAGTTTTDVVKAPPQPAVQEAPKPHSIGNPNWLSRPSADLMAQYYPERALNAGIAGSAILQCSVTAKGQLTGCSVASETPPNAGFGSAAQKLSRYFRMSPKTEDGQPVEGGVVRIPLRFSPAS
jgi:protein TonB